MSPCRCTAHTHTPHTGNYSFTWARNNLCPILTPPLPCGSRRHRNHTSHTDICPPAHCTVVFFLTSCFIFCLLFWTPCSLIIVPTPPPPTPPTPGLSTYRILLVQTQCWRALQTQHRGISGHDLRCVPVKAGVKAVYGPVRRSTSTFTAFSIWPLTLGLEPVCGVLNLPMYSKPNTTRPHFELLLVYIFLDIFTYWSFGLIPV